MAWLIDTLRENPELAVFLVLAVGSAIGLLRWGAFEVGPILGSLIAGLLLGYLGIPAPTGIKDVFFLLFLFAVGIRAGADFFRGLRASALPQLALICLLVFTGFTLAWGFSRAWSLDAGTSGGLFAGGMTNSTSLGTVTDATTRLPVDAPARERQAHNAATAYAMTYISGLTLCLWFLPNVAPRLMRINLKDASREYEQARGARTRSSVNSAYRPITARSYRLPPALDGLTVSEVERRWPPDQRAIIERVRHGDALLEATPTMPLHAGDVVAVGGRSTVLIGEANPLEGHELDDRELLVAPTVSADLVLTSRALAGLSLRELSERVGARGIFLLALHRGGLEMPFAPSTVIERGDVLRVSGAKAEVARVAAEVGYAEYPTTSTDLLLVSATVVIGGLFGVPALSSGGFTVSVTTPVGVLLAGLTLGHLRSRHPRFGRIPDAAARLFESMGLAVFLGLVGLQAGPQAIDAIRASGISLLLAGALITLVPHIVTILVGFYVMKMHPSVLLGLCAGAGTTTPSLIAIERAADSHVPAVGYGMANAVGNVLTAVGGTLLVMMGGL
jgi:putative transport protein